MSDSSAAFRGSLSPRLDKGSSPKDREAKRLRLPFGRGSLLYTRDRGEATIFGREMFASSLRAIIRDKDGKFLKELNLGTGKVTNIGAMCLANDPAWASPSGEPNSTLAQAKWHAWGTSETAATNFDLALTTPAAPTATEAEEGVNTLNSKPNESFFKSVKKITAGSTLKITEWGLHTGKKLSSTTGTPFTAATATGATVTGTPYTASTTSVNGQQKNVVIPGTTAVFGLITSNTTSALVIPAWYKTSDGTAGATPGATEAFTLRPVLLDHRVFGLITVESGQSIEFPYELQIVQGG
jgi:hypothetical protein